MNLVLKTPEGTPYKAGQDFSVVICCDSVTGERAVEVLHRLQKNLKREEGRLLYQLWTIETLAFVELQELAAVEMAKADMVIIGIREGLAVFETTVGWMNRWINLRKGQPGALVAVLDAEPDESEVTRGMVAQLKEAAAFGRMEFFATGARVGRNAGAVRGIGDAAGQFVLARKNGAQGGLTGAGRMPAETHGTENPNRNYEFSNRTRMNLESR